MDLNEFEEQLGACKFLEAELTLNDLEELILEHRRASDPETTCRFPNHTTMTWDAIAGSTQYNLYRGPLTNLVDTNADHLPDAGYGTCQNSRDAVLTDTSFVDADVPTLAQKGFFYLVAYKSGGVEKGLGTNSYGTARTELATCP